MPDANKQGWVLVVVQVIVLGAIIFLSIRDKFYFGLDNAGAFVGLTMIIIGLFLALISFINFGQIMTPNPVPLKDYKLRTTGMYKYIRHPVYSALLFALLGLVIYSQSISGLISWIIGVIFISLKIGFEERQLNIKFPDYLAYQKRTKKLIPFLY